MDAAGVRRLVIDITRFGRFSVLPFSLLLPLLGAAVVAPSLSIPRMAALCAAAVAFHLFVYISNDVFDLPLDRTQPLRAGSPLVRGLVSPNVALIVALVPVPLAAVLHLAFGGAPAASAVLLLGMALGFLYNRYGKRIALPLLSDAIQGLGWVALALYGALATGHALTPPVSWLAATVFFFVLLVNTMHGGLRDLENDARHGARTTAIFLGARIGPDGELVVPRLVVLYGLALQVLLLLLGATCVFRHWPRQNAMPWQVMVAAMLAAHVVLLGLGRTALRAAARRSEMIRAGMLHLFLSIGVVLLPFVFFTNAIASAVIVASYALPLVILFGYLTWHARRLVTTAAVLGIGTMAFGQETVRVVPRQEIAGAMTIEHGRDYNLCARAAPPAVTRTAQRPMPPPIRNTFCSSR